MMRSHPLILGLTLSLSLVPCEARTSEARLNAVEGSSWMAQASPSATTGSPYDGYMRLGYDETHSRDYQSALINFRRALSERPGDHFASQAVRNVST